MGQFFVDIAGGSDSNDGLDSLGVNLQGAHAVSWTASTRTLTSPTTAFAAVLDDAEDEAPGRLIYLTTAVGGAVTPGLYQIESKVSDYSVTLYESPTHPDALPASTFSAGDRTAVQSAKGPWQKMTMLVSPNIAAGDVIWVKASGTYTDRVDLDVYTSTATTPIVIRGYRDYPTDGKRVTVDVSGKLAFLYNTIIDLGGYVVENFNISNSTSRAIYLNATQHLTLRNVKISNSAGTAVLCSHWFTGINVEVSGGSDRGIDCGRDALLVDCYIHGTSNRALDPTSGIVYNCRITDWGANHYGIHWTGGRICAMVGCTVDGRGTTNATGILMAGANSPLSVVDTVVVGCSNFGGIVNVSDYGSVHGGLHNCLYDNTPDYSGYETIQGEVLADPQFVDGDNGDYRLKGGSPCVGAGVGGGNIGWDPTRHFRGSPVNVGTQT